MTPEESQILYELGKALLVSLAAVTTYSLFYGIFVLLFSISTTTFVHRGISTGRLWLMFGATLFTFLLSTANVSAQIASFAIYIRSSLVDYIDLPLEEDISLTKLRLVKPNVISLWMTTLMPIISNLMVIWRASTLFPTERWVVIPPLTVFLASFTTALAYLGLSSNASGIAAVTAGNTNRILGAALGLSMCTNLITTALIGYKLFTDEEYKASIARKLAATTRATAVQRIIYAVVESGTLFFFFQFVYFVVNFFPQVNKSDSGHIAWVVFSAIYISLAAMYPNIVVVMVNAHYTMDELVGLILPREKKKNRTGTANRATRSATAGHLSFAVGPQNTTNAGTFSVQTTNLSVISGDDGEENISEKTNVVSKGEDDIFGRHVRSAP